MKTDKKWNKKWKYFGIGLLLLALPGSALLIPALLAKKIHDDKETNDILGI